jgi:PAS domain S-box-containing protein
MESAQQATLRLRQIEAVHREALQLERALIYTVDLRTGALDYVSPNAEELSGFTSDELYQAGYLAILARTHPEDLPGVESATEELARQTDPARRCGVLQYRWMDKSGNWRSCRESVRIVCDDSGTPVEMVGCVREAVEEMEAINQSGIGGDDSPASLPFPQAATTDEDRLNKMLDEADLGLTRIQRRVLAMVLAGLPSKQIARRLHRSVRTVEDHRYRIMRKVGAENSVDLARKVLQLGIRKAA